MTLNCVVVDDSAIQRLSIVKLIENNESLNLVAEYSSALETKNGLNTKKVDLIFLDIEMPVLNGFELLDVLNNKPQIIFVTGKTEYAFKAFNYDATDYLQLAQFSLMIGAMSSRYEGVLAACRRRAG